MNVPQNVLDYWTKRGQDVDRMAQVRYICQTDLYHLGKEVLNKDFFPNTHRLMCEFYVQKDPSIRFRQFGEAYKGPHDRMQLVPRKTFKSSIKVIDNLQWIICYPEIRIMTVTAEGELATAFIDELTTYLTVRGKAERNPETNLVEGGRPTEFQVLFPEHCLTENEGISGEYWTPARSSLPPNIVFKDPTAGVISMAGTSSGWHCDIIDYDDPVSDRNSESGNQLEKLKDRIDMIFELVEDYGFRHTVATRYHPNDPYGEHAQAHGISELYGDFESEGLKYMCRPCLWLKGQPYQQPDYKFSGFPKEEDVDLFFPERAPYMALRKKFKNQRIFFSQQLNNPVEAAEMQFTADMIRNCCCDHTALPKHGTMYAAWDLAFSIKNYRDYTVGAIGMIDDRREWWIVDIIRGRFDFSEKCFKIVNSIKIHRPQRTGIEDVAGAQNSMTETLWRTAKTMNVELAIDWLNAGHHTDDEKYVRMSALHPWVMQKRIHFLNTIECMDDLVTEFTNIGPKRNGSVNRMRNDIPDAIAHLVERYSGAPILQMPPDVVKEQWQELRESEFERLIFGRGKYAPGGDWDKGLWNAEPREQEPSGEPRLYDSMTGLPINY